MHRIQPKQDLSKLFQPDPKIFDVASTPTAFTHRITLDEEFEHVSQFAQIVDILEGASENDVIQIRLTSPGGSVAAVLPLLTAMEYTDAFVHVHVDSDIASAATFVMLKAHMVTMNKHISVMVHTASWGYGGHSGNMEASTNHYVKNIKSLAHDVYDDFLNEQEFEKIFNGLELWFTPEEVYDRLKSREEKRKTREEEEPASEEDKAIIKEALDMINSLGKEPAVEKPKATRKSKKQETPKEVQKEQSVE